MVILGIFFRVVTKRNLNYTKSNKKTTRIYQHHNKKKKKKKRKDIKYYNFYVLTKRKKLIRNKVEIENADMRIIK